MDLNGTALLGGWCEDLIEDYILVRRRFPGAVLPDFFYLQNKLKHMLLVLFLQIVIDVSWWNLEIKFVMWRRLIAIGTRDALLVMFLVALESGPTGTVAVVGAIRLWLCLLRWSRTKIPWLSLHTVNGCFRRPARTAVLAICVLPSLNLNRWIDEIF